MPKREVTKVVASALLCRGNALLLLQRARDFHELRCGRGLWEPPGGQVDAGETIERALCREVREETGITLTAVPRLVDACNYVLEDGDVLCHRVHVVFAVQVGTAPAIELSDEHNAYRWIETPAELAHLDMVPALHESVARRLDGRDTRTA